MASTWSTAPGDRMATRKVECGVMSWTDYYPILTEEMISDFETGASQEEVTRLVELFAVETVWNRQRPDHIISIAITADDLPQDSRNGHDHGRCPQEDQESWFRHLQPLFRSAEQLAPVSNALGFRVYLDKTLAFLAPALADMGIEVYQMAYSRSSRSLAKLWRLLALEEEGVLVTISEVAELGTLAADTDRTTLVALSGLWAWRIPTGLDGDFRSRVLYKPFCGLRFGAKGGEEASRLLKAFIWHSWRGSIPPVSCPIGSGSLNGAAWHESDFDEWFIAVALYPRFAANGLLTLAPAGPVTPLFSLDIEYATWANSESQLVFHNTCPGRNGQNAQKGSGSSPRQSSPPGDFGNLDSELPRQRAFVISLSRARTRRINVIGHMAKINFPWEIIDAVDGTKLKPEFLQSAPGGWRMSVGEIACYLSHVEVLQRICDYGLDYGFILEDDFRWGCFDKLTPHNIWSLLPEDADHVQLHDMKKHIGGMYQVESSGELFNKLSCTNPMTIGYLISNRLAKFVLDHYRVPPCPIDHLYIKISRTNRNFSFYDINQRLVDGTWDLPSMIER